MEKPRILILIGSDSDLPVLHPAPRECQHEAIQRQVVARFTVPPKPHPDEDQCGQSRVVRLLCQMLATEVQGKAWFGIEPKQRIRASSR